MSKGFKIFLILFIIVFSLLGISNFVITPRRILGNDVGNYHQGDMVFFISRRLLTLFKPLEKGTVVGFKRTDVVGEMESVAVLEGFPGDKLDNEIYSFSKEELGNTVPNNYYAVRFTGSDHLKAVAEKDVLWVGWFSIVR